MRLQNRVFLQWRMTKAPERSALLLAELTSTTSNSSHESWRCPSGSTGPSSACLLQKLVLLGIVRPTLGKAGMGQIFNFASMG